MRRYVVSCSHARSLRAAAYLQAAAARGMSPHAVLVVRLLNPRRLKPTLRALGRHRLMNKVMELVQLPLAPRRNRQDENRPLRDWLLQQGLEGTNRVVSVCRRSGIPVRYCNSLNDAATIGYLRRQQFDFAVYLGGGILRKKFIEAAGGVVFNAHHGPLPRIRGMSACEWSIYLGEPPSVTVHQIDPGIDTGPICTKRALEMRPGMALEEIRGACARLGVELLLGCVAQHLGGTLEPRPQRHEEGRQYFVIHPFMEEIVRQRLLS